MMRLRHFEGSVALQELSVPDDIDVASLVCSGQSASVHAVGGSAQVCTVSSMCGCVAELWWPIYV